MNGAVTSNVLMFLTAMSAVATVWLGIAAAGGAGGLYWLMAGLLAVATVVAGRAYRKLLRQLDAEERRT